MNSMTFDPFSGLDRLAQDLTTQLRTGPRTVPVDLFKEGDRYVLSADLPGVDPGSIDIDLDGHLLTIRAERTAAIHEGAQWLTRERRPGSYVRQFTLGEGVDTERISAAYDNGVLSLVIPLVERAKPRKIQIGSSEDQASISA
ncbi:Hsp20/alpha crystallin family protein [Aeromicrobium yanjiei]|uniref:Hsp20 family protein n=1 Tax=Aeromicrobium yanjiei TaxID=2662028 RepID=A0A5Q2MIY7_9ACTN|nr:Hsp20/alpha crystallin family protein [Aeromicrobium yanjiei]QGG40285.1 Hsp20 family protein [Aeromicrobium yanjiei]